MNLDAERATHVLAHDTDLVLIQPQMPGEQVFRHVWTLHRHMQKQFAVRRVVVADDGPGFQGHPGVAVEVKSVLDHGGGVRKGRVNVPHIDSAVEAQVVAQFRVDHRGFRIKRRAHVGDWR